MAKDLIKKLMCVNPEKRLTAKNALGHMWFKKMANPEPHSFEQHLKYK